MLEKIKSIYNDMPNPVNILICKVLNTNLDLQVVDEPKKNIPNSFVTKIKSLTDYKIDMEIEGTKREVTIYNALKTGDIVVVISFNNSQSFVIVDKVI